MLATCVDGKAINLNSTHSGRRKCLGQPVRPRVLIYSRDIGDRNDGDTEPDWSVIASDKVGGKFNLINHLHLSLGRLKYIKCPTTELSTNLSCR